MSTKLQLKCIGKSQSEYWSPKEDGSKQLFHKVDLFLGYSADKNNPNWPYSVLSSGSKFELNTINDEAANGFVVGETYDVFIAPSGKFILAPIEINA